MSQVDEKTAEALPAISQVEPAMPKRYSPVKQEKFPAGGHRSVRRLYELKYDPIGELVKLHQRLEAEDLYYAKLKSGEIVPLDSEGRPRRYSAQAHGVVREQLIRVSESLLRYGYGRVPETVQVETNQTPFVINLAAKVGK